MTSQPRAYLPLFGLFVVHLTADQAVGLANRSEARPSLDVWMQRLVNVAFCALIYSQICLVSGWIALAAARWRTKALLGSLLVVDLYVVCIMSEASFIGPFWQDTVREFLWHLGNVVLVGWLLCVVSPRGSKLDWIGSHGMPGNHCRFQFSLRSLLAVLTLCAVVLAVHRIEAPRSTVPEMVEALAFHALVILGNAWAASRHAHWAARLFVAVSLGASLGLGVGWLWGPHFYWRIHGACIYGGLLSLLFVGSILIAERCGYCLVSEEEEE